MSKPRKLVLYVDDDVYRVLEETARKHGVSVSELAGQLVRNSIANGHVIELLERISIQLVRIEKLLALQLRSRLDDEM